MNALAMYGLLALTTAPPLVPNAALLAWAGVLAADGDLHLALVLAVVAGSALLGDLLLHLAARRFARPVRAWANRRPRRRTLLERTSLLVDRYGVPFVAGVRFLPAGRVAAALVTGLVRYPVRRYLLGCAIAETLWASYSVGLGYLGTTATRSFVPALALSLGLSAVVCGVTALVQHVALGRPPARSAEQVEAGERGEEKGEPGEEGQVDAVDAATAEAGTEQNGGKQDGVQQEDVRGEQGHADGGHAAEGGLGEARQQCGHHRGEQREERRAEHGDGVAQARTSASATGSPVRRERSHASAM
ncbi:DedA family protein [Streptomyces sp. NPDC053560]|uniref:DedA family protein n=1 Tax=Streptomyces sp. NPDC053560 TaxID=3365711 RepID=UPI0037CE310D